MVLIRIIAIWDTSKISSMLVLFFKIDSVIAT